MKKHILILTMSESAAKVYMETITTVFESATFEMLVRTPETLATNPPTVRIDLYLVSKSPIENTGNIIGDAPFGVPIIDMITDFKMETIQQLKEFKNGTSCLLANSSEFLCLESIVNLRNRGVHNIRFFPFYPGMESWDDLDYAITIGEPQLVPATVKDIFDTGHRHLTPGTLVAIAISLNIEHVLNEPAFKKYSAQFPTEQYHSDVFFKRSSQYETWLKKLIQLVETGVLGVNENRNLFCCNEKAKKILKLADDTHIDGVSIEAILPAFPIVLKNDANFTISNRVVKYKNITLTLSVHPIVIDGKFRGQFIILEEFLEVEKKQQNARMQLLQRGHNAKYYFEDIVGESKSIQNVCQLARKMAKTSSAILIKGESGTGKELLASAIHNASYRSSKPYIAINCAAMPEQLLESELFGYEEGAFTGAKKAGKLGLFEYAHKGTLFLDEIENMSPSLQVKLLRVLQEKEVMRVGGYHIINVDVRIIAATNTNIETMVKQGSIRKDLYYRLNTLQLELPPLCHRVDDLPLLVAHLIKKNNFSFQPSQEVLDIFKLHPWEGNIRELENCIEYFHCLEKPIISVEDLPSSFMRAPSLNGKEELLAGITYSHLSTEYFILDTIHHYQKQHLHIGRQTILKEAKLQDVSLTEGKIRRILRILESEGLLATHIGRGGSQLTQEGLKALHQGKTTV